MVFLVNNNSVSEGRYRTAFDPANTSAFTRDRWLVWTAPLPPSPHAKWRATHKRRLEQPQATAEAEARAVMEEARSFAQLRRNVLAAAAAGRSMVLDERSDMLPDHQRTLGHFG